MKRAKQLLWFIIPTVYIWFSIIYTSVSVKNSTPKFLGLTNYWRLLLNDAIFKKALFNTFLFPALIAFLFCVVLYIAKRLINRKYHIKYINAAFYTVASVFTTACMYFRFKRFFSHSAYTLSFNSSATGGTGRTFQFQFVFALLANGCFTLFHILVC